MGELSWDSCPYCATALNRALNPEGSPTRWALDAHRYLDRQGDTLAWICHACCGLFHRYDRTGAGWGHAQRLLGDLPGVPGRPTEDQRVCLTPTLVVGGPWPGLNTVRVADVPHALDVIGRGETAALPAGAWLLAADVLREVGLCDHLIADRLHFGRTGRLLFGECPHCPGGGYRRRQWPERTPVPPKGPCQAYWPGHQTHWIHARHAHEDRHGPATTAVDATVVDARDGLLTLDVGGRRHVLANHEPRHLQILAERYPHVVWVRRWHIVYFGNHLINVVDPAEATPCRGTAGQPLTPTNQPR